MTVNAFWFGVLITVVVEIVILIIVALITVHHSDDNETTPEDIGMQEIGEDQFKKYLRQTLEEIASENRFIIGEAVEDKDDD